ncbi:hypothetical protein M0R72_14050 [Candidatus Pacearchaeota archaeon]|jgi:hypothetical protein|nr:hypothetical protein [Candidatus Pacearchaeota archaeon]
MASGTGTYTGTPATGAGTATTKTLAQHLLDDLSIFFDATSGFAVPAIYTPAGGAPQSINVIFDKEAAPEIDMIASRIYCEAKTSDVIAAAPGDTIKIAGVTYKIKDPPHHTATGTSYLELTID